MRKIEMPEGLKITKDKIVACASVMSVVVMCSFSSIGISALLEADAAAARNRRESEMAALTSDTSEESTSEFSSDSTESSTDSSESATSTSESTSESSTSEASSSESSSETTTSTTSGTTVLAPSTQATTQTTIGESTHNAIVYATGTVNLRTGPGTSYESIRQLKRGDQIDVVAVTTNGWYRTIRGNYVSAEYTQSEPINTPSPTPKPATPTPKPATPKPATPTPRPAPGDKTLLGTYRVTFYIPVNGTRTASGATATMGTTVATNSDLPFGTVIYIENDPLGGDGYYTVQDRGVGSGVVDIFVDSMSDVPPYGVTTRKVYIVN